MRYGDLTALQEREYCKEMRQRGPECGGCPMRKNGICLRISTPEEVPMEALVADIPDPRQTIEELRVPDLVSLCSESDHCNCEFLDEDSCGCQLRDCSPCYWGDPDVNILSRPNPMYNNEYCFDA